MSPARYFIAAAIVLLLGAAAIPMADFNYNVAASHGDPHGIAVGLWAVFVYFAAYVVPVLLLIAGLVSLFVAHDD